MSKNISTAIQKLADKDQKLEKFSDLLDSIDLVEDKKKHLWKEIYENALTDRENAGMLFTDLYKEMNGASQHALLGTVAAKYLERMCKSNDQILRLVELIDKAEEESESINPDDVFAEIMAGKKEK